MQLGDSDTSLQIVGVYGLILCLAMLLCGAAIGRLVDSTSRNRLKHPLEGILCFILCSSTRGPQFVLFMQITAFYTYKTEPTNNKLTSGGKENSLHKIKAVTL